MFKKSGQEPPAVPSDRVEPVCDTPLTEPSTRSVSYIGPSLEINGELTVSESLIIEGHVKGTVTSKERRLTIGKQGRMEGELHAEDIEVRGKVDGEIYGYDRVRLRATSVVDGTLHCKKVVVDEGAELNGTVEMKVDRKELAKKVLKSVDSNTDAVVVEM